MTTTDDAATRLDAMIRLRRAAEADKSAREQAAATRAVLRTAAVEAVETGNTVAEVARLAGVRRATVHAWTRPQ